jgi:hypothetical protein
MAWSLLEKWCWLPWPARAGGCHATNSGLYRAEWLLAQDRGQPCGGREHPIRGAPRRPFANWVLSPQISERKRVCYAQRVRIETDCGGCSTHLITSAAPGGILVWCVIDLCYYRCEIKRTHAGYAHLAAEDTAELAQTVLANSIHFSVLLSRRFNLCDTARWDWWHNAEPLGPAGSRPVGHSWS